MAAMSVRNMAPSAHSNLMAPTWLGSGLGFGLDGAHLVGVGVRVRVRVRVGVGIGVGVRVKG